ncbi:helix-turn-helix transcriptional regulator [bacterium]|nr:helix-turn-helix transcriptional regulator [bacterium]
MKTFAERFASLRYPGETQKEFADRLGITQASISRYLRGQQPDRESLEKIAQATGVSVDWLLTGKEPEIDPEVEGIIRKVGARMAKPVEDREWAEVALTYIDEMRSLSREEKEYIKHIVRDLVNDPERRELLIDYWNYLRFREKTPEMPVPKRKRRKKSS